MIRNEKGSALLTVMIMILVFTTLGLVLMAATINGAKRTAFREEEIITNLDALTALKEGVAHIQSFVNKENDTLLMNTTNQYDTKIKNFIDSMNSQHSSKYKINNISDQYNIGSSQTRVLEVQNEYYKQKVYITAMPSFLKYGVGSRGDLTINGSLLVDGDIYAKDSLNISNNANYIYNDNKDSVKTNLPAVVGTRNVTIESKKAIDLCNSNASCYEESTHFRNITEWKNVSTLVDAFSFGAATLNLMDEEFIDVDLYQTFVEKLAANHFPENLFNKNMTKEEIVAQLSTTYKNLTEIKVLQSFDNINEDSATSETFYYEGDAFIDTDDLTIGQNDWLIINGNAHFESEANSNLNVKANILVTGNVKMSGDLSLTSVMYTLGDKTSLNNVNINGDRTVSNSKPTFILLADGHLEIARINKFKESENTENEINGFLYTSKEAEVYGVGSLIKVNGGIFSNNDLVLNSYRGDVSEKNNQQNLEFSPKREHPDSRLRVKNDKKLFLDQMQALPKVNKLSTVPDRIQKLK